MKISNVQVKGYRNLKEINIELNRIVIFIGENNSGKSNLLKAITLPFLNDEIGNVPKNLGWQDINTELKDKYFTFIKENLDRLKANEVTVDQFKDAVPSINIKVTFQPDGADEYYVHRWCNSIEKDEPTYFIEYRFCIENPNELLDHITSILSDKNVEMIEKIKMNLLPIEMFKYSVVVPLTNEQVIFNDLANFKYNSLAAERDDFSNKNNQLGSKALVKLLHNKLSDEQKIRVEESYEAFFRDLKDLSNLDIVFNWQQYSTLENATEFFNQITLIPNMPSMYSLLNNVRLGFGEEYLHNQGLGYRNLVYLLVMINSLEVNSDIALNILTIEEPEAHLCISNERLLASFINTLIKESTRTQLFISTHSSEFLNKLELENVTILTEGSAFSLKSILEEEQLNYLAKKPNLDFMKFLFSRKCILVEGPSEEILIKSYLNLKKNSLHDIEVISLHKGFIKMIDIWLKVNEKTSHRLGIIRDFDNQPKAQENHERYNSHGNVYIKTTTEYTLEPEFVNSGENFEKLKSYFREQHGWQDSDIETPIALSDKWRRAKADTMLYFCQDFGKGYLENIELPEHIQKVLDFLQSGVKE
ncbi:putative ATP-dependent endonuclease of OLD family [Bacillus pumilus]|uniref:ATP-dependent nuclease n=1 Tax=Bacillus pumilus TaxID=1408 RepID=UPI00285D02F6|nr:AAA family ATPase [Bacillus pumilus]MDR6749334.1 putative ATP-dependent endonuclease of OLD family [Bacillus pumilus]